MTELEPYVDAILVDFGVTQEAICELVSGKAMPKGLLPIEMPANMATVEEHFEDKPFDYEVYKDSQGHSYEFGYGLDWNGIISDERTKRFVK